MSKPVLVQRNPDHVERSTVELELGKAYAILDLLFMVASDSDVESLCDDTLSAALDNAMTCIRNAKEAAGAISEEVVQYRRAGRESVGPV